MGYEIHSRTTESNEWMYRIWSTGVDDYISEPMTEQETMEWLLTEALRKVAQDHYSGQIAERFEQARIRGTSSYLDTRNTDSWDEPINRQQEEEELVCDFCGLEIGPEPECTVAPEHSFIPRP